MSETQSPKTYSFTKHLEKGKTMETYAIVGTTFEGLRRTITRNVRPDQIAVRLAEVEGWGVTDTELIPEAF